MLQLKGITKDYKVTEDVIVHALKDVSINFRKNEFVSILGPSGCGKTTLLNIIGGLDRYTSGDLIINDQTTKNYKDCDWDAYRNHSIGFVFQSYNLIPHMNILDNVTLSLSLTGASKVERVEKAKSALKKVGLEDQLKKFPNQLSGGQMQRVAIARAIVNNPDIILADEPTGALDTETGLQVMELLKEIADTKLVIMVTHNTDLANKYSTRIVNLLDGVMVGDSNPFVDVKEPSVEENHQETDKQPLQEQTLKNKSVKRAKSHKKVGISFLTEFGMAIKHLLSRKGRTLLTSFAGSIGIFGITLALAISTGMTSYANSVQSEAVKGSAINISERAINLEATVGQLQSNAIQLAGLSNDGAFPKDTTGVTPFVELSYINNNITQEYVNYVLSIDSQYVKAIDTKYSVNMHVLDKQDDGNYVQLPTWSSSSTQIVSGDASLITDNYDVLYKLSEHATGYPSNYTEVALVVDRFNRVQGSKLKSLNIPYDDETKEEVPYEQIVGKEYVIVLNDGWYTQNVDGKFSAITATDYATVAESSNVVKVKIVSVLRAKSDDATTWLQSGLVYLPQLTDFVRENAIQSQIGQAQLASQDVNVISGKDFATNPFDDHVKAMKDISAYAFPEEINIYPVDIDAKKVIASHLDAWNDTHDEADKVVYSDFAAMILDLMNTLIDVMTYVLVTYSAVSLIVSTVMISVITYTSVIERIKEIGVLRSLGARKRDIAGLFNAETVVLGTLSGIIGILFAVLFGVIINAILTKFFGVPDIILFKTTIVVSMMALSIVLTLIAGLIPARIASNKDPVTCLRTE